MLYNSVITPESTSNELPKNYQIQPNYNNQIFTPFSKDFQSNQKTLVPQRKPLIVIN